MDSVPTRTCTRCGEEQPEDREHFALLKAGRVDSWCRECRRAAARAYNRADPERHRARTRAWVERNRGKKAAYDRAYALAHPEVRREAQRRYRERNPEAVRERTRAWERDNPEKARLRCRRRYARKRAAEGSHTLDDVLAQLEAQKRRCWWCSCAISGRRYHVDHRIALAAGGSDGPENIVIACPECNVAKHVKLPWDFAEGRLL